jgi:DNA-binding transcriptional LysR family regulator
MGAVTNISLKQLRCFLAIAECGSFTGASARLFLTQSALTAAVQQLEDAVGLKLFDRTTRSVQLTREGEAFRPRAERILNDFDGAINDLRAISQSRSGEIRVVAAHSIIELFLAEAMSQFQDVYPGIHFTLREHGAELAEELVLKGEVDFGLTEQFKGYADLDYRPLFHDQFVVVASPGLIGCAQGVRWEALPASGFVSFTTDTGIGAYLAAKAPELLRRHIESDQVSSTMALFSILQRRAGYSIIPALPALIGQRLGLEVVPLLEPVLSRRIDLISRKLRALSPTSDKLLQTLQHVIETKAHQLVGISAPRT